MTRLLEPGEIIRTGDEYFSAIKLRYVECTGASLGHKVLGDNIRRPIPAEAVSVIRAMESIEASGQILNSGDVESRHIGPNVENDQPSELSETQSVSPRASRGSDRPTVLSLSAQSIAHAHASANEARADEVEEFGPEHFKGGVY